MTNTIIICHVLTPPAKYEKFIVGSQPMRMRERTTMNNNKQLFQIIGQIHGAMLLNIDLFTLSCCY